ncbi:hypothetical protein [Natronorubrum sulfidifaciens]|uniref:Uncharacterized protein n=1 Tax=Natronorubrum sulfidifaciens JCM 14089 TaxID=1230460 RepID=L9WJF2_9EURY|nr:hypothetical protein [Natronorubrum sulfidifaciens]ELY49574.1 hypothetical protein C495_00055 [Natronorubrum sulfidifaciens JCM 14089]
MTETTSERDETSQAERLRSVYLSVTGDAEPVVESQQEDSPSREIQTERADGAVGPAELHGLDDAIDDPGPAD